MEEGNQKNHYDGIGMMIILSGKPEDKNTQSIVENIQLARIFLKTPSVCSFTALRVKGSEK